MFITIDSNTYDVGNSVIKNLKDLARDKYLYKKSYAIYAVQKDDVVDMKRDVFSSKNELDFSIHSYLQMGFDVYYVTSNDIGKFFARERLCKNEVQK